MSFSDWISRLCQHTSHEGRAGEESATRPEQGRSQRTQMSEAAADTPESKLTLQIAAAKAAQRRRWRGEG